MNAPGNRAPFFVVTGIVVLSILFFFLLTLGGGRREAVPQGVGGDPVAEVAQAATAPSASDGIMPADGNLSIPMDLLFEQKPGSMVRKGTDTEEPAREPTLHDPFAGAQGSLQAIAGETLSGLLDGRLATTSELPLSPGENTLLAGLFDAGIWSFDAGATPVELGQFGGTVRWILPLRAASSSQESPRLYLDLEREESGNGWRLADVRIPPELVDPAVAALKAQGKAVDVASIRAEPDALMTAETFMNAVTSLDFAAAIRLANLDKVTREKVAGLFIIIEEGNYRLRESKSLMATVAGAEAAWIIGRIQSQAGLTPSDFGIELAREADAGWRVTGLHFSKLLATFAASTSPGNVPYTPIVDNPSGGESLVLYFGYDEDMLHLRAQRQLAIVAALLRDDASKSLRITGHADALGTEDYNLALSARRAFSVRDRLIELGVPTRQINTEGFGESAPLAANVREDGSDNPEGRSRNRRTEIFLDF